MPNMSEDISRLTFASFCDTIAINPDGFIEFTLKKDFKSQQYITFCRNLISDEEENSDDLMHKSCQLREMFRIYAVDDNKIISDTGTTLKFIDQVLDLSHPIVIKIIMTIMSKYRIVIFGNSLMYCLDPLKNLNSEIWHFLKAVNFFYYAVIFYDRRMTPTEFIQIATAIKDLDETKIKSA